MVTKVNVALLSQPGRFKEYTFLIWSAVEISERLHRAEIVFGYIFLKGPLPGDSAGESKGNF